MKKIELALAGGLLLTPMIASAQQAKTNQTGNALPPITVVTGKSAKAGKASKPAKTGTAQKAASSSAADASASGSGGGAGEGAAAQGGDTALPPSVTSQVAGTVVVTEADLGRVSSVTREGLNLMGGAAQTSFYQAADIVPSIIVASPDPYGLSPTRNINIAGKSDFHLARNINGLPISGIVGGADLYDLENIARLDVYRGAIPADKSLGISNASGVIDQIILGPQDKASNFIEQSFGSWNFSRTFARIDTGLLSTGTKFFVSGSTTDSDKWTGVGDQSRDNAALGWSQTFGNALKIDLDAVYNNYEGTRFRGRTYNDVQHLGKNYDFDYNETLTGDPAKDANYYKFNFVSAETFATQANIDYQFDKGQHIVFKPYYWHNNGAQYSAAGRQVQIWRQQNDNVGGVLEYDGHFDTGTDVVAGYWWQSMEPPPPPTDQRRFSITADGDLVFASWSTIAKIDDFVVNSPYVQATQDIGPVTLTAGLRYMSLGAPEMHYFDSTNVPDGSVDSALAASKGEITGTAVSAHDYNEYLPNVGITTDLGYGWTTNLSYGRNFGRPDWGPQASNYISNRATFQAKGFTLQDLIDNVRPEIADQVSAQATYRGYGFTVAPAVFYAEHDNKQVKVVDPDLSKFAGKDIAYYQGTGSSTEYGAELQVAYQFGSELFVFGSGTLASETFDSDTPTLGGGRLLATKGKQIPNTPQTMLKAGFTYSWNGFALTPVVRYIGERYGDAANMEKVSGFTLVDLTASYGIENMLGVDEATLRFGVMNLFDRKYVAEISPSDTDLSSGATYYVGAPRTFVGTVAVKF